MKVVKFLAWTFFIFCSHAMSSMALHRAASKPQHGDFDSPKPILQGQVHGLEGKMGLSGEGGRREYKGEQEIFRSMKGTERKGSLWRCKYCPSAARGEKRCLTVSKG
ncbi:hypothetical protein OIU78_009370 [Salix suchowensis]|nr:hypothetical protein OIU78_009370 [Salix suchowensis]